MDHNNSSIIFFYTMRIIYFFKFIIYSPVLVICLFLYFFNKERRCIIDADLYRLQYRGGLNLLRVLVINKEFRNVLYYRFGKIGIILNFFMKGNPTYIFFLDLE